MGSDDEEVRDDPRVSNLRVFAGGRLIGVRLIDGGDGRSWRDPRPMATARRWPSSWIQWRSVVDVAG